MPGFKDSLVFDVADWTAGNQDGSDTVGSYIVSKTDQVIDSVNVGSVERLAVDATLKDGSGNALTSTAGALDVNVKSPIQIKVDLDGVYDSVNNADPDSVGVVFHTRATALDETVQVERPTAASPASVLAADVAKIKAVDNNAFLYGTDATSGDLKPLKSINDALTVHIVASDSTTTDAALANSAVAHSKKTLTAANTAEKIVATSLTNRKYLLLYNNDNKKVFVGSSTVTAADGFPLSPKAMLELRLGAAVDLYFVSSKTGHEIRVLELA